MKLDSSELNATFAESVTETVPKESWTQIQTAKCNALIIVIAIIHFQPKPWVGES